MSSKVSTPDESINRAHFWIRLIASCVLLSYFAWFWVIQGSLVSGLTENWGQFGDFIGGILNPIIAYAAFYWLTESVRLQKTELIETRRAMQDSAESQKEQVRNAQISVRLNALTAMVNGITAEIQIAQEEQKFIADQMIKFPTASGVRTLEGYFLTAHFRDELMEKLGSRIRVRLEQRLKFENEISNLLGSFTERGI